MISPAAVIGGDMGRADRLALLDEVQTVGAARPEENFCTVVAEFPAEWDLGKHAGFLRNADMADYADAALVIWDGKSKGSADMLSQMHKRNKPVAIYEMERL